MRRPKGRALTQSAQTQPEGKDESASAIALGPLRVKNRKNCQLQTPTRRIINRKESSINCASSGKVFFASPTRNQLPSQLSQWKPVITLNFHFIQWWSRSVMSNSLWPPWTVACQAPSSMELSREGYWSGLTFVQNNPSSFLLSVYKITFLSSVCWLCLQLFLLPNCNALLFWINPFCPYNNKMFSFLG